MGNKLLIELQYLPNAFYLSAFLQYEDIIFNDQAVFMKQTFQNRAYISGANKVLPLIIPVKKGKTHIPCKDVAIDYQGNWAKVHWHSIVSSYNKSPYFYHYRDHFEKHYFSKPRFLIDFNILLFHEIMDILELSNNISFFSSSDTDESEQYTDKTNKTGSKKINSEPAENFIFKEYQQVFSDRFGFIPGLSVIDLIFNTGPEARQIIERGLTGF